MSESVESTGGARMNCDWCGRAEEAHSAPCPGGVVQAIRPAWAARVVLTVLERSREQAATQAAAQNGTNGTNGTNGAGHYVTVEGVLLELFPDLEVEDGEDPMEAARESLAEVYGGLELLARVELALTGAVQVVGEPEHPLVAGIRYLQQQSSTASANVAATLKDMGFGEDAEDDADGGGDGAGPPILSAAPPAPPIMVPCPVCSSGKIPGCLACGGYGQFEVVGDPSAGERASAPGAAP